MELKDLMSMTNEHGRKFLDMWFKTFTSKELLGIERTESNILRKEFTIVYLGSDSVRTAVLPDASTTNKGCCFFGDLQHFAMCYAEEKSGIHLRLGNNGHLMWPWWYTEKEDYLRWKGFYNEMFKKYS